MHGRTDDARTARRREPIESVSLSCQHVSVCNGCTAISAPHQQPVLRVSNTPILPPPCYLFSFLCSGVPEVRTAVSDGARGTDGMFSGLAGRCGLAREEEEPADQEGGTTDPASAGHPPQIDAFRGAFINNPTPPAAPAARGGGGDSSSCRRSDGGGEDRRCQQQFFCCCLLMTMMKKHPLHHSHIIVVVHARYSRYNSQSIDHHAKKGHHHHHPPRR